MVKKLIINCDAYEMNEEKMKNIRNQFEKEDVIFLDVNFSYGVVEYDEYAIARKMVYEK